VGAYEVTVSASPFPLQVGLNDISIMLGRLSDAQLVLDAAVSLTAEPADHAGEPQTFAATHANAANKLFYAANVTFPTPGRWKLTIQVDGLEDSVTTTFETQVEGRQFPDLSRYLSLVLVGLPSILIMILVFVLSRRSREEFHDDLDNLEGEAQ
jgi:hypothetical protein